MGSCCSTKSATAVGVEKTGEKPSSNGHHTTSNTGDSAKNANGFSASNIHTNQNSSNFAITPKYTAGMNGQAMISNNSARIEPKSTQVFPTSNGYRNSNKQNSTQLLLPGQTNDILSTTYNNTDHLRASPYLSGLSNRKRYNETKLESDRFRGFDAPITNSDSEHGDFDSDIENDKITSNVRSDSASNVSLTSLIAKEVADKVVPEIKEAQVEVLLPDQHDKSPENDAKQEVVLSEKLNENMERTPTIIKESIKTETLAPTPPRIRTPEITSKVGSPRSKRISPTPSRSGSPRPKPEPDPIMETLEDAFFRFARYGEVNSEGREMNNKNWAKLCRDCDFVDNRNILTGDVDVIFSRHKPKGQRLIDFDMFVKCLEEIADRKYKSVKDETKRRRKIYDNVIGKAPEYVGITGVSKTGNVGRMTDHMLYPAAHKMRFDEEGRGLGVDDMLSYDPTEHGYVQGYKETNTYDLKVSRPSSRSSLRPVSRETSNISPRSSPKTGRR